MPGAGSMLSANNLANALPKDGTVVAHFIGGIILQQYLGNPGAQFDASKLQYLGAPTPDSGVCVVRKDAGISSLAELRNRGEPLIFAGTAAGSNTDDIPNVLRQAFGLNLKLVSGYAGTAEMRLAIDRGEAQAGCWGWESLSVTYADGLSAGSVVPIAQAGDQPLADLPSVPMFRDLATTDVQRQVARFGIDAPAVFNRPFVVAGEVPPDRVAALRQAFADTLKDPEFIEDAKKAKLAVAPISGEHIAELVQELFSMPADVKTTLQSVMLVKG
jgi:tripartite-type tricarboxylate transporter receptor subunit TctC